MISETMVELSRWQFAATSLYHFLFVPLTLGLSWLLVAMEVIYVRTGNTLYRDMVKFWGKIFGINFALGVATGITLEFEFGTNWSNYSHYVGDIFGAPLAFEGLMAFFLESTFIGLFFAGWNRFSKKGHLVVTILTALGSNISAMWILIANAWMQYPEFAQFSPENMRMEMTDWWGLVFSPVAQVKFIHALCAGYCVGGMFVIGVSAWYMLKGRCIDFAKRSMTIAITFTLCALAAGGLTGDQAGLEITAHQPAKLAAMEAEYETQKAPASWAAIAIPDEEKMERRFSIDIPWLFGLLATHSLDTEVPGLRDIVATNENRVRSGSVALAALSKIRSGSATDANRAAFDAHKKDLGYGMLLLRYAKNPEAPTDDEVKAAARGSVPSVWVSFYSFRVMVGLLGLIGLLAALAGFFLWYKKDLAKRTWLLKILVPAIALPYIAAEAGWLLAEVGRQPWAIQDVLPTFAATSTLSTADVAISLGLFVAIYTVLLIIMATLIVKAVRKGPDLSPDPRKIIRAGEANAV
jgi:cytochrome d ubiquinol oxidase subunit I